MEDIPKMEEPKTTKTWRFSHSNLTFSLAVQSIKRFCELTVKS